MSLSLIFNIILTIVILAIVAAGIYYAATSKKDLDSVDEVERERQRYSIKGMSDFIKHEFDEITRMNLYDLALSEDEFERRKNTKYDLKKALKGAGYASANDKKYVKTLMFDLLRNQYKVTDRNLNYAIPFDNKDKLTSQDKFDIVKVIGNYNEGGELVEDSREVYKGLTPKGIATIIAVPDLSLDAVSLRYEGFDEPMELTCCLDIMDMVDKVKELD